MFRHPRLRPVAHIEAAIRAAETRIAELEAAGHDTSPYRREIPFLQAELQRAETRAQRLVA